MSRPAWLLGALVLLLAACGTSRSSGERHAPSQSRTLVLGDELAPYRSSSLLDALRALRPAWFRTGTRSGEAPVVYVDGRRFGGMASLALIQVPTVVAVRFYTASEAHGRFGPGHLHGALDVTTAPPPVEP